nr:MAG TPA: Ellis van Creveld protein 2 like protein [Caudoviricetes sp.]
MDIVSLLIVWLALFVFRVTGYKRRRNCEWLRELQRIEDEE